MSKPRMQITIDVVGGDERVTIRDDAGSEKVVTGFAMFGASEAGELYVFSWGRANNAAHAVSEGLACACNRGDEWYQAFYRCLLAHMVKITGIEPHRGQHVTVEDVLERWEKEDKAKAVSEVANKEPKDWN